jgi:hypothetical protein
MAGAGPLEIAKSKRAALYPAIGAWVTVPGR